MRPKPIMDNLDNTLVTHPYHTVTCGNISTLSLIHDASLGAIAKQSGFVMHQVPMVSGMMAVIQSDLTVACQSLPVSW
jgi:hypothetical protein